MAIIKKEYTVPFYGMAIFIAALVLVTFMAVDSRMEANNLIELCTAPQVTEEEVEEPVEVLPEVDENETEEEVINETLEEPSEEVLVE